MSDYTPDEEVVREFYVEGSYARGARPHEGADEFDRFIARVKADALREAADTLEHMSTGTLGGGSSEEWVRVRDLYARADLIEDGGL